MARQDLFTGRSGQLALMAEFLIRQLNVAIPEVDLGDDVIVVRADNDTISRVQVKTATAREQKRPGRFSVQFKLPLNQLQEGPKNLVYAFVVRRKDRWEEFLIVPRSILFKLRDRYQFGSPDGEGNLILNLSFGPDEVTSKGLNLHPFRAPSLPGR